MTKESTDAPKGRQGFASMSLERRREIAGKGGKAAHAQGKAHQWTAEQAKEAGRKGGLAAQAKGLGHRWRTTAEAQEAGRKGGTATQERLRALASCEGCGVALEPVMPTAGDDCREGDVES